MSTPINKTLWDALVDAGAFLPKKVWDYRIFAPCSLDDQAEITLYLREEEHGKQIVQTAKFAITNISVRKEKG